MNSVSSVLVGSVILQSILILQVTGNNLSVIQDVENLRGAVYNISLENLTDPYKVNIGNISHANSHISQKIIKGIEATQFTLPYQAAIYITDFEYSTVFCGGSLISSEFILTAAHCIFATPSRILVILGNTDLSTYSPYEIRRDVKTYIIHSEYDSDSLDNDICLLKLNKPVQFSYGIFPIKLPTKSDALRNYLNQIGIVSGFGNTEDNSGLKKLLYVRVRVMNNWVCNLAFYDRDPGMLNICTSGYDKSGACHGDSGGPLAIDNKLVGVVSFGAPDCSQGFPTIYTRVPSYLDWISYNTNYAV